MTDTQPRSAVRARGFTKLRAESYETVDGDRKVRVTKQTRMHSFKNGYSDTGRERVVFDGYARDAQMLRSVLSEVLPDVDRASGGIR